MKFVDADDFAGLEAAITEKTRAIYTESLGNPKLDVVDIAKLAEIAHKHGLPLVVDNTTPSAALTRPIEWGADIVVNSATKFLGGHGTTIGGVIVDGGQFDWAASGRFKEFVEPDPSYHGLSYWEAFGKLAFILKARVQGLRDTGAALSPFSSFLLLQGIETLHLRLERHSTNALAVAKHLEAHAGVEWVNYPGLASSKYHARAEKYLPDGQGAIVTFGIKGGYAGRKDADRFAEAVFACGEYRRCEVAGDSSRFDDASAIDGGRAGGNGCHAGAGAVVGGDRGYPRYSGGPGSGDREGNGGEGSGTGRAGSVMGSVLDETGARLAGRAPASTLAGRRGKLETRRSCADV